MYSFTILALSIAIFYLLQRFHNWKAKDVKPYKGGQNKKDDSGIYDSIDTSMFNQDKY
jgi:hypothetical protein